MTRRQSQRGTAILITLILIVALLGGGAVLLGMQLSSTRSAEITRSNVTAMNCAEAGVNAARRVVATNHTLWNAALAAGTQPAWLDSTAIDHDLDGDGADDFTVVLKDNDDEQAPAPNNLLQDNDQQVWIVSTCTKFPENAKRVTELVRFNVGGKCYQSQLGGCGGNGNSN
jgi:type II secretory pathway pseudopilin PulG